MFRKTLATTRSKIIAVASAAALLAGLGVVLAGPAQAVNCAFGDNFYKFKSMYTGNEQIYTYSDLYGYELLGDGQPDNGTPMCQVKSQFSPDWYGWVIKSTDLAMTYNATDDTIWWKPWADLASQRWQLNDQLVPDSEEWGIVLNDWPLTQNPPKACYLAQLGKNQYDVVGTAFCSYTWPLYTDPPPHNIFKAATSWQLDGPVP